MKPGDFYKYPIYSLLLFPTRETAAGVVAGGVAVAWAVAVAPAVAAYWSRHFGCRVTCIPVGKLFMILTSPDEKPNQYGYNKIQVLYGETVGWINWNPTWMKFEKVTE